MYEVFEAAIFRYLIQHVYSVSDVYIVHSLGKIGK